MRVLILGGNGMLGHKLCQLLPDRMEVWATLRVKPVQFSFLPSERLIEKFSIMDIMRVAEILDSVKPDAVVNAIGIVKQREESKQAVSSIQINALFPHQMADLCVERDIRMIQVSTDCVFSELRPDSATRAPSARAGCSR